MNQRLILMLITLLVIVTTSVVTLLVFNKEEFNYRPGVDAEIDNAVNKALSQYTEKKNLGYDFSDGPCLTNDLSPNWVADLVHNPRIKDDDLGKNQCQAFLEGRAKHFVELDLDGNLVRVR